MQTEIEAKFLDIDPDALREKLKMLGAKLVHPERLMKRKTFDLPNSTFPESSTWVRVRDEGDKITLSYKRTDDHTHIRGTKEITVTVTDFEKTCDLLTAIGLINKSFQETKREKWKFGNTEIAIDTWPWIPTFVELEDPEEAEIKSVAGELNLPWSQALYGSVITAYKKYYDVTAEEIDHWKEILFIPVPEWLEKKRKK